MLKEIKFMDWKSFDNATLYVDPLTVLIGTNASGKSNALDGISFLSRTVAGITLQTALTGDSGIMLDSTMNLIRGGVEWAARKPHVQFTLKAVIEDAEIEYEYSITVKTSSQVELVSESLYKATYASRTKKKKVTSLFDADIQHEASPSIIGFLNNGQGRPKKEEFKRSVSIISQLRNRKIRKEIEKGINVVIDTLENIFILDPVPSLMRDYRPLSAALTTNASNLAGVLAALPNERKEEIQKRLSRYISRLPEGDIHEVWAETVGIFNTDAMLYCKEKWLDNEYLLMDARGMSDGTLRFLGILTALLIRPSGSLIIVEEVDNGLHPSRAKLLLEMLKEIGQERNVDILITTHNPALMDELGPEMVPYIVIAHRSKKGESKLTLLEDIENLPKLFAVGPLGKVTTKGYIEDSLSDEGGADNEA